MYANFWNQLYHILHFSFAFLFLMIVLPRLLFKLSIKDSLEKTVANFMMMGAFLIIMGYMLVATKLFEFLSIAAIIGILIMRKYITVGDSKDSEVNESGVTTWIYDYFEGLIQLNQVFKTWWKDYKVIVVNEYKKLLASIPRILTLALIISVFVIAGYIRFYDALHSPTPTMSDGSVSLAWVKYIDARILFHDGFYPQGMYIILDTLFKFADIDHIYIMKYAGPLHSMLTMLGFYFVISRITSNTISGLIAAAVYGLLGPLYSGLTYERQAATNSQEFAFIFVLPALYFYIRYLQYGKKELLWAATAGTIIVGAVHEVAFVWLGFGMISLILIHLLLLRGKDFKRLMFIVSAGIIAVIITVIPFIISKLMNIEDHSSSQKFATNIILDLKSPLIHISDYLALCLVGIVLLHALFKKTDNVTKLPFIFISIFTLITFLIYYYGGVITHLEVVETRSIDVWVLCIPLIAGVCWSSIVRIFSFFKATKLIELGLCIVMFIVFISLVPINPIIPYKMESDTAVEQYLRISKLYTPMKFMIISPRVQEYANVLGNGNNMYLETNEPHLLGVYDPEKPALTKFGEKDHAPVASDIFVFYEKKIFKVSESNTSIYNIEKPRYDIFEKQYAKLDIWIQEFKEAHKADKIKSFSIFYEDDAFVVYHLHREDPREEIVEKIWS